MNSMLQKKPLIKEETAVVKLDIDMRGGCVYIEEKNLEMNGLYYFLVLTSNYSSWGPSKKGRTSLLY